MTKAELDRINRAEEIQRYTENRCEALEKENAELRANEVKWHKVAEGDLPHDYRYVWTNVGAGYYDGEVWRDEYSRLNDVVAWCEPEYKEEIEND